MRLVSAPSRAREGYECPPEGLGRGMGRLG